MSISKRLQNWKMHWHGTVSCITCHSLDISATEFKAGEEVKTNWNEGNVSYPNTDINSGCVHHVLGIIQCICYACCPPGSDTGLGRSFLSSCRAALSVCINRRIVPFTVTCGPGSCSISMLFAVVSSGQLLSYWHVLRAEYLSNPVCHFG